jgi:hypothetical protein
LRRFRAAALLAGAALASSAVVVFGVAPQAGAAPAYQMPFPCNQVWYGQTRTDHSPANAVDFNRADDDGDPVAAAAAGRVSRVANEGSTSYGRWIEIDHGGGFTTRYAHLSAQRVAVGDQVSRGQLIGNVGSTGGSTGPHLHFEERSGGSAVKIVFNGTQIFYWARHPRLGRHRVPPLQGRYELRGDDQGDVDRDRVGDVGVPRGRGRDTHDRLGIVRLLRRTGHQVGGRQVREVGRLGRIQHLHQPVRALRLSRRGSAGTATGTPVGGAAG